MPGDLIQDDKDKTVYRTPAYDSIRKQLRTLTQKPTSDEQLTLYGYGKVADKKSFEKDAEKPSFYNLEAKYKYNKWKEVAESGMTPEEAEAEYIKFAKELIAKYGTN